MREPRLRIIALAISLLIPIIGYAFRIEVLMLASILENKLQGGGPFLIGNNQCRPEIAFHRGYSLKGKYQENSKESLQAALRDQIKKIEIDVSIIHDEIYVGHSLENKSFPLQDFTSEFSNKFDLVIVDIKEVVSYSSKALDKLSSIAKSFPRVIFIGRKCDLLEKLADLKHSVSCEAFGLLAHRLMDWEYWSVDYRTLGQSYQRLLSRNPIKIITWTLPTASQYQTVCPVNPSIILVSEP